MTSRKKSIKKMRENQKGVRFEDVETLLVNMGFEVRSRGSHYVFKKDEELIMVVKPHGRHKFTAQVDVNKVLDYLEEKGYV